MTRPTISKKEKAKKTKEEKRATIKRLSSIKTDN